MKINNWVRNHDWDRTVRSGERKAREGLRKGDRFFDHLVAWELLREAASVSSIAHSGPPRTSYPTKSAMPDSVDDVSYWQLMAAYVRGNLSEAPAVSSRRPMPSSEEIDRCDAVLHVWHNHSLMRKGNRSILKRAIYLRAVGVKPARVRRATGLSKWALDRGRIEACEDIMNKIAAFLK